MNQELLVGTYTRETKSEGIYRVQGSTVEGATVELAVPSDNPSYLAMHPTLDMIYAVNEVADFEHGNSGAITAFARERDGSFQEIAQQPSMGADPCHISVASSGAFLIVANYTGGSFASLPIDKEGRLTSFITLTEHQGRGSHAERQKSAHVHASLLDDNDTAVLIADLGTDHIVRYAVAPDGKVEQGGRDNLAVTPGRGPRLMVRSGKKIYLVNELANTVSVHSRQDLSLLDEHSTLPQDHVQRSIAAHIEISADQAFLYVSNRDASGHGLDSIAVFSMEPELKLIQVISTGGGHPRHFALSNDGKTLIVANQHSDEIRFFSRDVKSGQLSDTGNTIEVPSPSCVLLT